MYGTKSKNIYICTHIIATVTSDLDCLQADVRNVVVLHIHLLGGLFIHNEALPNHNLIAINCIFCEFSKKKMDLFVAAQRCFLTPHCPKSVVYLLRAWILKDKDL